MGKAARLERRAAKRSSEREAELLYRLCEVAPEHIEGLASRSSFECIEAACLGLLVLQRLGISAIERPVAVDALNPSMVEAFHAGHDPASLAADGDEWIISMGHEENLLTSIQWHGHLVLWTSSGWMVDLWPVSRPDKGIDLPAAYCLPIETLPASFSLPDGGLVRYYDKPANLLYRLANCWPHGFPEWESTIAEIVQEVSEARGRTRRESLFTRCADAPEIREYAKRVFDVTPAEHVWDLAEAANVSTDRIRDVERAVGTVSDLATQEVVRELVDLKRELSFPS